MQATGANGFWRITGMLLVVALLAGCSSIKLAYNNLDRVAVWRTTDYVPLERNQRRWLRQEFQAFLHWHRNEQLEDWAVLLRTLDQEVRDGVTEATLLELENRARELADDMLLQIKPTMIELLTVLNERQIDAMATAFTVSNAELNSDYEGLEQSQQREVWRDRVRDGLRRWVGRLNDHQESALYAASQEIVPDNSSWVAFREQWQAAFFEALEQRDDREAFVAEFRLLLFEPERWHPSEYQQTQDTNQPVYRRFAYELLNSLDEQQQRRLTSQLTGLASDLEDLARQNRSTPDPAGPAPRA